MLQERINPYNKRESLTPRLLRANKTIYSEASSILYAQNCFDLTLYSALDVASFFERIGRNNTARIRYIYIDFPWFDSIDLDNITLRDNSVRTLAKMQSDCAKLSTLTTSLYSINTVVLNLLDALTTPQVVTKALTLVDARFRAILSL